jgi:hypothetical protein
VELGRVERDRAGLDEPGLGAEREHLREEARQGVLVAGAEARDRRVVGRLAAQITR